jgi:hypothetical protein
MTKRYLAREGFWRNGAVYVNDGRQVRPLSPRFDLARHSPGGFAWGYNGSGPAQLALAVLADAIGAERALRLAPRFADRRIARLDGRAGFDLALDQVLADVAELEGRAA